MTYKTVFTFRQELDDDPGFLHAMRSATLDPEEKVFGLKGTHGLVATEEWWENIRNGIIRSETKLGRIARIIDDDLEDSSPFSLIEFEDGSTKYEPNLANSPADQDLYQVGARIRYLYAFDEGKSPDEFGKPRFIELILEVAICLET
ncbi:hypothetical protein ABIE09_001592 [Lysobacter enzymogenes]|jgi:hypothetical protein|uniref:hypothetical protein n=1 Tax=Lysobacter enzymogenes TaxID=69 RepID=UPI0033945E57